LRTASTLPAPARSAPATHITVLTRGGYVN
jgi:hypothetical protein